MAFHLVAVNASGNSCVTTDARLVSVVGSTKGEQMAKDAIARLDADIGG